MVNFNAHAIYAAGAASRDAEVAGYKQAVEDLMACFCGCPIAEHESYGEDGESCGQDDHECVRVFPAVAESLRQERLRRDAEGVVLVVCPECGGRRQALSRVWKPGAPQVCFCGAKGEVLYHYCGGWYCRAHEYIGQQEYEAQLERAALDAAGGGPHV